MPKYGVGLALQAFEGMRDKLASGGMPMLFDHDPLRPLDGTIADARIEQEPDGEHQLVAILETEQADRDHMQEQFAVPARRRSGCLAATVCRWGSAIGRLARY